MNHLLQKHTVDLYSLNDKQNTKLVVPAKELLSTQRFDLFAKLAYIRYRKSNEELALRIYKEHIKAFNPDLKEPGRDDKNSFDDFIKVFNSLIDTLETNDFDDSISAIPVSEDNVILDGAHRVSALIYHNKAVTVLKFNDVVPKCPHDYLYFRKRGVSQYVMDRIAFESSTYFDDLYIACLWPKLGKSSERRFAENYFNENFDVLYKKNLTMTLSNLKNFIKQIYQMQIWTKSNQNVQNKALGCYASNKLVQFIIFRAKSLEEVLVAKENIRNHYGLDKHALHITDNSQETKELMELVLTDKVRLFTSNKSRFWDEIKTIIEFRKSYWTLFKVKVYNMLVKIGILKK